MLQTHVSTTETHVPPDSNEVLEFLRRPWVVQSFLGEFMVQKIGRTETLIEPYEVSKHNNILWSPFLCRPRTGVRTLARAAGSTESSEHTPANVRALMITIRIWVLLYYSYTKEPQAIVLVVTHASAVCRLSLTFGVFMLASSFA